MDKKSRIRIFAILLVIFLLSIFLVYATTTFSGRTSDGIYDLDGTDITVNATVTTSANIFSRNTSLWTDIGTWSRNQTITYTSQANDRVIGFIINAIPNTSISDGTDIKWALEVTENNTAPVNVTVTWAGNNTRSEEHTSELQSQVYISRMPSSA